MTVGNADVSPVANRRAEGTAEYPTVALRQTPQEPGADMAGITPPCAACGTSDEACRARGGWCCESCRTADTHVAGRADTDETPLEGVSRRPTWQKSHADVPNLPTPTDEAAKFRAAERIAAHYEWSVGRARAVLDAVIEAYNKESRRD